ncbi:sugar phosphate isomerase/epimerase [Methylocapsa sp. S129]|uniref:sugar phosphate isomerase/epimerase family protein n=1 Tax=Methylocapsa sp. S129 TaxID=1641869 RepID=UPI00131BD3C7|nr:sugar phosphate isomerase/epimerase [Methylocapsa sp. S129]
MNLRHASPPPLGIAHFTTINVEPASFVEMAARVGYAAVGLRLYPAFPGAPFYEIAPGSALIRDMRARLAGAGLTVYDIEFVTIDAGFEPESLKPVLESAAELGARRLSLCGDDPDRSRLIANFAALCDLAAPFGMGVDLEGMAWRKVASFLDAVRIVTAADRPNGGALVDALHLARTGGSPADVRSASASLIRSAQLCDAPATRPPTETAIIQEARSGRLPPGEGDLPLRELLAALPETVVLSVEVPIAGETSPERHARRIFEATQRLFRVCRDAADGHGGATSAG